MIHRILRSWWLYPLLGVLLVFIYAVSAPIKIEKIQPRSPMLVEDPLALWPKELDGDVMMGIISEQPMLGWFLFVLVGAMGALFFGGVALSFHDMFTGSSRKLWGSASKPMPPWSLGDGVRIFALVVFVAGLSPLVAGLWTGPAAGGAYTALVAMLALDVFIILAVLTFSQGRGVSARAIFLGDVTQVRAALSGTFRQYVSVYPWLFLLLFFIARIMKQLGIEIPPEEMQQILFSVQEPRVLVLVMILACVIGPIAEELFFRGVIFGALRRKTGRWVALTASGAAFALVHTNVVGFVPIMALGCLLADLYDRTGMLLSPIAVHIAHNTLLMSMAIAFRQFLI